MAAGDWTVHAAGGSVVDPVTGGSRAHCEMFVRDSDPAAWGGATGFEMVSPDGSQVWVLDRGVWAQAKAAM
jgi:hypothetical protein